MQIRRLSESELGEALANLERCLEGLDQDGEEGLQSALDRICPRDASETEPYSS
jgi:hypothetical protein